MLTSYISSYDARVACAMSDEEHIAYIQEAIVDTNGQEAEENWTGNWERHCWEHDEHHVGSWAVPIVPQQQLCLFLSKFNTGSPVSTQAAHTHGCLVSSALESGPRLDLGLVDQAKEVTNGSLG